MTNKPVFSVEMNEQRERKSDRAALTFARTQTLFIRQHLSKCKAWNVDTFIIALFICNEKCFK